jgi:alpha-D-ribose 1-methylphosphonate 5-triphosphate synthase subunit PhnL
MDAQTTMIELDNVSKSFVMHLQGARAIPVVGNVSLAVHAGECVVLGGASGAGKSSILKMIYGSYRCEHGRILVRDTGSQVDIATATPQAILALRASTIGYVSQFLRVIPRVSALDIIAHRNIQSDQKPRTRSVIAAQHPRAPVDVATSHVLRRRTTTRQHRTRACSATSDTVA